MRLSLRGARGVARDQFPSNVRVHVSIIRRPERARHAAQLHLTTRAKLVARSPCSFGESDALRQRFGPVDGQAEHWRPRWGAANGQRWSDVVVL